MDSKKFKKPAILVADFLGDKEMKEVAETMSRIQDKVFGSLPPGFSLKEGFAFTPVMGTPT